jgi:hypothetical protein
MRLKPLYTVSFFYPDGSAVKLKDSTDPKTTARK